jgi:hypothetical protein
MIVEDLHGEVSNTCNPPKLLNLSIPQSFGNPKRTFFVFYFLETICSSIRRCFAYGRAQRSETVIIFNIFSLLYYSEDIKGEAISVTGRGGPYGCETSRLPHFV